MNTEHTNQSTAPEPFGYFKTEPFGWTDCEKGDEGAVPLYEHATVQGLQSQLEAERGSLFAESQRKQQLQGQVDALMEAMAKISRMTMSMYTSAGEAMRDAKRIAHEAIAAAERVQQVEPNINDPQYRIGYTNGWADFADAVKAASEIKAAKQQAEPVAWHTNDPCVSSEHIEAIAKVCKIIPSYTTVEYVARIVGFGHVLLADKSVQEAFVRANSHLLRTDAAQPPAVAVSVSVSVPQGWASVSQRVKDSIIWLLEDTAQVAQHSDYEAGIKADHELAEACQLLVAMLAAAPQAALPAPTIKLGLYGRAFDTPQTRRAYTYREQPDNIGAYKLGRAVLRAASGGDSIDYGLSLLKHLQAEGFGVFELGDQQEGGA